MGSGFAAFLLRFLLYAAVMGVAYQIAQTFWLRNGLDGIGALDGLHALGVGILMLAPIVLALVALVARPLAIFVLFYLVGAMLTAPFALAKYSG